ncbi:hypothetical protein VTI28DRAFT_10336 [Corynascus sepedonium]
MRRRTRFSKDPTYPRNSAANITASSVSTRHWRQQYSYYYFNGRWPGPDLVCMGQHQPAKESRPRCRVDETTRQNRRAPADGSY